MTQTIALNGSAPEINPLYIKLRRRFSCSGDRTIGEVKAQEAIRDGFEPYATPTRRAAGSHSSECHVTRANSLPYTPKEAVRSTAKPLNLSGGAIAVIVLFVLLLVALLFSGARINELNRELTGMQGAGVLEAEKHEMALFPEETDPLAAAEYGTAEDGQNRENLLRAFSEQ